MRYIFTILRIEKSGLLRYDQPRVNPNCRYVETPFKFAFQYLFDRGSKRRSRVQFDSINEPFSSDRFHFGKIKDEEILFEIKNCSRRRGSLKAARHVAIVNVSPIEWGHFLLVPSVEDCLAQRLNTTGKARRKKKLTYKTCSCYFGARNDQSDEKCLFTFDV